MLPEETYHFAVAQYRYEALNLAVSEVGLELGTGGAFEAGVPAFLDRARVEQLVAANLDGARDYLESEFGVRLMEQEIERQRARLRELEEVLRPWWKRLGSIERLVDKLTPEDVDEFQVG